MVRFAEEGAGDEALERATGRTQDAWFAILDAAGATGWTHTAIARHLVGEGVPSRVAALLASERKKTERVAHGVPVHEFQVGSDEGQIPVSKLQRKVTALPRALKPAAVSDLNYRLKALQPTMQMPKGPLPKGARMPKMPKQQR